MKVIGSGKLLLTATACTGWFHEKRFRNRIIELVCRAIADQLLQVRGSLEYDHIELRKIAAKHLRDHSEEYKPFVDVDSDQGYEVYCAKVESSTLAEWGGQVEIRAIANSLDLQVHIYDAEAPVLVMGDRKREGSEEEPLRLTFHRHYYALGEHYNSVEKIVKP